MQRESQRSIEGNMKNLRKGKKSEGQKETLAHINRGFDFREDVIHLLDGYTTKGFEGRYKANKTGGIKSHILCIKQNKLLKKCITI